MTNTTPLAARIAMAVLVVGIAFGTAGCIPSTEAGELAANEREPDTAIEDEPDTANEYEYEYEYDRDEYIAEEQPVAEADCGTGWRATQGDCDADSQAGPMSPGSGWSCYYDATFNRDWHDDVLCRSGDEIHRPYLRDWDEF